MDAKWILGAWIVLLPGGAAVTDEVTSFEKIVAPFLTQHCVRCHGPKRQKAQLMLHKMAPTKAASDAKVWEAVLAQVEAGDMPPEDEPRPPAGEVANVIAWIRATLRATAPLSLHELTYPENGNHVAHELLFGRESESHPATPARIWRVRPSIYESFVERASGQRFHHRFRRGSRFSTPWGLSGDGIRDYASLYWIGEAETELLISNAMRVADAMTQKRAPHAGDSEIFRAFLRANEDPSPHQLEEIISTACLQILERTPTADETSRYLAFLRKNVAQLNREKGLQTTLAAILLHPDALFRFELGEGDPDEQGRVRLAPIELAHAIAYALTDESPDEVLRRAARDGRLSTATEIRAQVLRILEEQLPRVEESQTVFVGHARRRNPPILRFFQEYFGYTKAVRVFKDLSTRRKGRLRGNYSPGSLVSDTNLLIIHLLKEDKDVFRELLTTERSFVATGTGRWNPYAGMKKRAKEQGKPPPPHPFVDKRNRINEHYNLDPADWTENMPFPLDKTQRAGVLTQPSWLIAHSTNFENHAILRGKWVFERLLGGTIPNTPITVDAQLPDREDATLRERMSVTRETFCWKCHQNMDPLGLPFEMFDHFGRFRKTELGKPVDTTGALQNTGNTEIDGEVENAVELVHRLASSERARQVFIRHVFRFFMGRNETPSDARALVAADRAYVESGGSMKQLVASILSSDAFLYRIPLKVEPKENLDPPTPPADLQGETP